MGFFQIRIMAVPMIFRLLIFAVITRCKSESSIFNQNNGKLSTQIGEILKPPPLPLAKIAPLPFHGGSTRLQRHNLDEGYQYPPPPPPPPPVPPSQDFKFPAPFYKQYNFNFVPPPQPFTTTPSSSIFQKVSGWLFSSPQTSYGPPVYSNNNIAPLKKDCNPCNLVPWIPVIRYDLAKNNAKNNLLPTYGPPSPTAFNNVAQFHPQPFLNQNQQLPVPGRPHAVYGPPPQNQDNNLIIPSSTYGPPSPTHTVTIPSPAPISSTYSAEISSSYGIPSTSLGQPSSSYGVPSSSYNTPSSTYGVPSSSFSISGAPFGVPSSTYGLPSSSFSVPSSTYGTPTTTFVTPSPNLETPHPITTVFNSELSTPNGIGIEPASDFQLPNVKHPSGFRNSYGEPITDTHALDIPYSVSATAAESTKIKEEVVSHDSKHSSSSNGSLALANPAPFTVNRGRNIHTLQPVALPNLSVSPLPPIFNARPFRPILPQISKDLLHGVNYMQQNQNNIKIEQSVPIAEFTQSIDYPPSINSAPVIDIDTIQKTNKTKAYRGNGFIVNEVRDISSQASEDHVSATKSDQDSSFESTGIEFGNDLYDTGFPNDLKPNSKVPCNHKKGFADLRGIKDEDVDKYRTDNNLQNIDSPLLYLKPSAPHKDFENFVFAISTPSNDNSYEIYDDIPTTAIPQLSTQIPSSWDESRTDYSDRLVPPPIPQVEENKPKIVQIIVPYTTNQQEEQNINFDNLAQTWTFPSDDEYQGRKVPSNIPDNPLLNSVTENYSTVRTTTEEPQSTIAETYESDGLSAQAILNDLYDVKEPPFDIVKLQHTIDDWTEQEYSKHYKLPQKNRPNTKYSKQIPDDYFTTVAPTTNYVTAESNYDYKFYDHEGQGSVQYAVTDERNKTYSKSHKEYNTIERTKSKLTDFKNDDKETKKPHIYTAASSFRSSTTTPAPWGKIQTSISPLTKEKVYVVTSKPWRDDSAVKKSNTWYDVGSFESKRTSGDNYPSASDNLPFKSPRFSSRPSFGFSASGAGQESLKSDSSYAFSKSWHQSINELESDGQNRTVILGGSQPNTTSFTEETTVVNMEERTTTITTTTAELPEDTES